MNQPSQVSPVASLLVVDDTLANLQLLTDMLNGHNYEVRAAINGKLALGAVSQRPPDLILLDIKMPGMNGFEVCAELKRNPESRDIPIIFISALDNPEDKVRAFEAGGVDYITKPFQESEVLARVSTHLQLRKLQIDLEQRVSERTIELSESRDKLRDLSAHMQNVREEERLWIAQELHDELGACFTGLNLGLGLLRKQLPPEAPELVNKASELETMVRSAAQVLRGLMTWLRPPLLDDLGLVAAIHWYANDFSQRTGIECRFDSNVDEQQFESKRAIVLFRIFQEALSNVAKYAEADTVEVTLNCDNTLCQLKIADNGIGAEPGDFFRPGCHGVRGMEERALALGGAMTIESIDGTSINIELPLTFNA